MFMKQKVPHIVFVSVVFFFWVSFSMLMVFLISALYYACNMLEIVESTQKSVHKRTFDTSTFLYFHFETFAQKIQNICNVFSKPLLFFNSLILFLTVLEFFTCSACAYFCNQGILINFGCIDFHKICGILKKNL